MSACIVAPHLCPGCGAANDCQLATDGTYKGPCWCLKFELPPGWAVPAELRGRACFCERCLRGVAAGEPFRPLAEELEAGRDFHVENGAVVFTAAYLARRGYCCDHGCRNCPYESASGVSP